MQLIAGLFLVALGIFSGVSGIRGSRQGRRRTATAMGVVVGQDVRGMRGGPVSFPVVNVSLPGAGERTVRGATGRTPPAHAVGDSVDVHYDPADPADATVGSPGLVTGLLTATGAVLVVVGCAVTVL